MAQRFDQRAAQPRDKTSRRYLLAPQCSGEFAGRSNHPILNRFEIKIGRKPSISSWSSLMWVLLLLPFIGLLWVPFYNFQEPALFGFPFFYWYQLAWVPISSLLIWLVYRSRAPDEAP
jgi:Protein of unknown function (DUF3311)